MVVVILMDINDDGDDDEYDDDDYADDVLC